MKNRNDRRQVGIAAAFAVTVDGSLDHYRAAPHGFDGIGHCQTAVVVGMNAELERQRICGFVVFFAESLTNGLHDRLNLKREAAAVGVAENNKLRPGVSRRR